MHEPAMMRGARESPAWCDADADPVDRAAATRIRDARVKVSFPLVLRFAREEGREALRSRGKKTCTPSGSCVRPADRRPLAAYCTFAAVRGLGILLWGAADSCMEKVLTGCCAPTVAEGQPRRQSASFAFLGADSRTPLFHSMRASSRGRGRMCHAKGRRAPQSSVKIQSLAILFPLFPTRCHSPS